jgi:uncharacterized protein (DUF433 family)
MLLEDYFDFLADDDIRIKDTRVGIETVLDDYIHRGQSPEAIAQTYPSLTLEQVYATILYYLHNKEALSKYLENWMEYCLKSEQEYDRNPPTFVIRLRQVKAEREAAKQMR